MSVISQKPQLTSVEDTDMALSDQGYTYEQAGQSYNEAGVTYGGFYGAYGDPPRGEVLDI